MPEITSRECKAMLDPRCFASRGPAAREFWAEVASLAKPLGVLAEGEFKVTKKRDIEFLDTPHLSVDANGFLLRRRAEVGSSEAEYTLKCRSDDRYVAAAADVAAAGHAAAPRLKFEEDIAAPFRSRFSRSNTITAAARAPRTLGEAAAWFPALGKLERDGLPCPAGTPLQPVNPVPCFERVLDGPVFSFDGVRATVALILWTRGSKGRLLVAEFSFRYADRSGNFRAETAFRAMKLFAALQRLDWFRPGGETKTEYAYGTTPG